MLARSQASPGSQRLTGCWHLLYLPFIYHKHSTAHQTCLGWGRRVPRPSSRAASISPLQGKGEPPPTQGTGWLTAQPPGFSGPNPGSGRRAQYVLDPLPISPAPEAVCSFHGEGVCVCCSMAHANWGRLGHKDCTHGDLAEPGSPDTPSNGCSGYPLSAPHLHPPKISCWGHAWSSSMRHRWHRWEAPAPLGWEGDLRAMGLKAPACEAGGREKGSGHLHHPRAASCLAPALESLGPLGSAWLFLLCGYVDPGARSYPPRVTTSLPAPSVAQQRGRTGLHPGYLSSLCAQISSIEAEEVVTPPNPPQQGEALGRQWEPPRERRALFWPWGRGCWGQETGPEVSSIWRGQAHTSGAGGMQGEGRGTAPWRCPCHAPGP